MFGVASPSDSLACWTRELTVRWLKRCNIQVLIISQPGLWQEKELMSLLSNNSASFLYTRKRFNSGFKKSWQTYLPKQQWNDSLWSAHDTLLLHNISLQYWVNKCRTIKWMLDMMSLAKFFSLLQSGLDFVFARLWKWVAKWLYQVSCSNLFQTFHKNYLVKKK
jgi:hypothetical protein